MKANEVAASFELARRIWYFNIIPRKPDMYIGGEERPYIRRWYVLSTLVSKAELSRVNRKPGSITFRRAAAAHRLELPPGVASSWSAFFTGRYQRKWGFHCPKGWIQWERFVKANAPGKIGPGCEG